MQKAVRNSREHFLETYIRFYKEGRTRDELAEELGITIESVYSRYILEKKAGAKLPLIPKKKFKRSSEKVDKLLKELEELANGTDSKPEPEPEATEDEVFEDVDIESILNS